MKKTFAILLLYIHLFNLGAPLLLHAFAVYRSDRFFDAQINKNLYNVDDLTEICIPADNPHVTCCKNYVNISGRVQFGETAYNYVRIRMTRTAIYLLCVPNYSTTHLSNRNIIDARQIPDIPVPKKEHVPFAKALFAPIGCETICERLQAPVKIIRQAPSAVWLSFPAAVIPGPGQPPDYSPSVC